MNECSSGKTGYDSADQALKAGAASLRANHPYTAKKLRCYMCMECLKYHLTKKPQGKNQIDHGFTRRTREGRVYIEREVK